jgi:PAS domain S-box-containing protein
MRPLYTRRNIILGLSLLLLVLAAFISLTWLNTRRAAFETTRVDNSLFSLRTLENVMDDMQDIETGQRGYIISHNTKFLQPYYAALKELGTDTTDLRSLIKLYPGRAGQLESLLSSIRRKAEFSATSIALINTNRREIANQQVGNGAGRELMDSIRFMIGGIENADRTILASSNSERQQAARSSSTWLIALVTALVLGLIVLTRQVFRDIRFKEEDEKKIKYLATITEKTSDAIISTDLEGNILSWNEGAEIMFGRQRADVIGRSCIEITRGPLLGQAILTLKSQATERSNLNIESAHHNSNGEIIFCLASLTTLRNESGNLSGFVVILRDITARKREEQLLEKFNDELNRRVTEQTAVIKNSEERYRSIIETAHEGIWMTDKDARTSFFNDRMAAMLGYTREEFGQKAIWEMMDDYGKQLSRDALAQRKNGKPGTFEFPFVKKDGSTLWALVSSTPVMLNGSFNGSLAMVMDITERRRAQEHIRRSNESFELISRTTNDAIWEWSLETGELWANETHQQLYGLAPDEPVPTEKMWADRIHPDDRDVIIKRQEETLASDKNVFISEYRFNTSGNGYRDIYDRCYIVRNESGKAIRMTGSMMDITERKQVALALAKSEEEARFAFEYSPIVIWEEDFSGIKQYLDALQASGTVDIRQYLESRPDELYKLASMIRIVRINQKSMDFFGVRTKEEVFKTFPGNFTEESFAVFREEIIALYSGQEIFESELPTIMPDGTKRHLIISVAVAPGYHENFSKVFFSFIDITDRKNTEQALRAVEETRKLIMDSALDAIICTDDAGLITVWTPQCEKVFGFSHSEAIGNTLVDLIIPPHYRKAHEAGMEQFAVNGNGMTLNRLMELSAMHKAGHEFPIEFSITAFTQGDKQYFCSFIRDISERKKAQQQIVKEKALSDTTINSLPGVFYLFAGNRFIRWNRNFEIVSGYSAEELKTLNPLDLALPEERAMMEEKMKDIYSTGSAELEAHFLTKDGGKIPYFFISRSIDYNDEACILGTGIDISELKKAQYAIAESERTLRTIINSNPQCIKLLDRNGLLLEMNPAGLAMIEADDIAQVRGHSVLGIIDEEYRKDFMGLINDVFHDRDGKLSFSITGLKGKKSWLETHSVPMKDSGGTIQAVLGVTIDITAKRQAEEELRRNEEKYRTLVEQAVDAIALYDGHGRILDVNTGSASLLGYSKTELMGMALSDILSPDEIREQPVRYDVLSRGESTVKQRLMRKKDGSIVETEVRSQQLPDGRFLSVIRDLSERTKAQQQIAAEKRLSDKLIDSLPGIFYLYDEERRFLRWNKQFQVVSGYSAEEIALMNPLQFFDVKDRLYMNGRIELVFQQGEGDAEAYFVSRNGDRRMYYFKAVRLLYNGQVCLLGTGIDIEDRKAAQEELASSNETLRTLTGHLQNIREEERSNIAREIHDELGQQLTVLKMDVSWINKKMDSADENVKGRLKELVEMLDNTVRSVRKISSDLRPSMLDDLGLAAAIEWQAQEFEKRSGIAVSVMLETGETKVENKIAITLFRIFQESLTNIARHSGARHVEVKLQIDNNGIDMSIRDDGQGFIVKGIENKKTLGILGMRERVAIIDGQYTIESAPGKGTTVKVQVPLPVIV